MMQKNDHTPYTHMEYRRARVVHIVNALQEEEFVYKGKLITKEEANAITQRYMEQKRMNKGNKSMKER
ncbi:hypothetical protein ATF84_101296 [[Clostridium] innocuum]|nr:hypothetical protein ATF84_101296 [[Clostridium] innocuum]SSA37474.1 hypothetical protein SAMN04487929_101296 [[Clostridium] innocuum]